MEQETDPSVAPGNPSQESHSQATSAESTAPPSPQQSTDYKALFEGGIAERRRLRKENEQLKAQIEKRASEQATKEIPPATVVPVPAKPQAVKKRVAPVAQGAPEQAQTKRLKRRGWM